MNIPNVYNLKIVLFLSILVSPSAFCQTNYVWSVVPQFSATTIHRDWTPLLNVLQVKTGYKFTLKTYDFIPDFEKGFLHGEPDFAYMNPYHAVMANEAHGYVPIIRNGKRLLTGIIAVRKDSGINNVQQLSGKKIAFPAPNAFAAALYMRTLLREIEGVNFTAIYAGTHANAYLKTLHGRTAATGSVKRVLFKQNKDAQDALKIIYKTPGRAPHPISVHQRVPTKVRDSVQAAILELNETDNGRAMLKQIYLGNPIRANYKIDYLPLKNLNLKKYFVPN